MCRCYACRYSQAYSFIRDFPETSSTMLWDVVNRATINFQYNFLSRLMPQFPGMGPVDPRLGAFQPPPPPPPPQHRIYRPRPMYPPGFVPINDPSRRQPTPRNPHHHPTPLNFGRAPPPAFVPTNANRPPELRPERTVDGDRSGRANLPQTRGEPEGASNEPPATSGQRPLIGNQELVRNQEQVTHKPEEVMSKRDTPSSDKKDRDNGQSSTNNTQGRSRNQDDGVRRQPIIPRNRRGVPIYPRARLRSNRTSCSTGAVRRNRANGGANRYQPGNSTRGTEDTGGPTTATSEQRRERQLAGALSLERACESLSGRIDNNPSCPLPDSGNLVDSSSVSSPNRPGPRSAVPLHAPGGPAPRPPQHHGAPGPCTRCPDHSAGHAHYSLNPKLSDVLGTRAYTSSRRAITGMRGKCYNLL